MGKNQSASGLTNIIQYNNSGITFVSGSTVLMAISSSGAITTTGVISGSDAANAVSASFALNAANATSASQAQNAVSSSFAANAANANLLDSKDSTEFAITGSNIFTGTQYVTSTINPNGFGASASIYTDGGLRVTKDTYVSGTMFVNNLTVFGTQSINYITSSQLNISTNIISVNTDTPSIRFGGLSVYDSGSTRLTGSMLWDSERDHWVYSNPSGSSYNSGMLISGPRNSGSLGTEQGTLNNVIVKGQGGDHVTSSQMIDDGTTVRIPGNLQVTGSTILASALTGSTSDFSGLITGGGTIRATGATGGLSTGSGVEIRNNSGTGEVFVYNRSSPAYLPLRIDGSTLSLNTITNGAITLGGALSGTSATFSGTTAVASVGGTSQMRIDRSGAVARIQNYDNGSAANISLAYDGGNVGIGTTSPSVKLEIQNGYLKMFDTSNQVNAGYAIQWASNNGGTNVDYAQIDAQTTSAGNRTGDLVFRTSNAGAPSEKMRITSSGVVDLTIGQIKFPATQVASANANTLDDYEEGTYTPDIRNGGWAFGARSGFYTKIGNLVTVNLLVVWTANNTPSGASFEITLPFAAFGSGNFRAPAAIGYTAGINFNTSRQLVAHVDMSNNYLSFQQLVSGGTPIILSNADINNSGEIQISVTYQV